MFHSMSWRALILVLSLAFVNAVHGGTTAAINASPSEGRAPLGVSFDANASSADATSYLWEFGDGSISTAKAITHIYNVAGTYIATLTTKNDLNETSKSQVTLVVTGTGEGPVAADTSFRWAPIQSNFVIKHNTIGKDVFNLVSSFNTVDLPGDVQGLAASFSINSLFTISGVLGQNGGFESAPNFKPSFFFQVNLIEQTITVYISKADMRAALGASGATNATVTGTGLAVPLTFTLVIGAQAYTLTENYSYTSATNGSGKGFFNLKKGFGTVEDGFFVISRASAVENIRGDGHFFEFDGYISKPMSKLLQTPGAGVYVFKFNDADREIILSDRGTNQIPLIRQSGTKLNHEQSDRDLGGIRRFTIDTVTRAFTIKTWDILQDERKGGTGLPLRGKPFTAFNFALRLELDQADGTKFEIVTATRMTRRTKDDAFWQTGRRNKQ